MRPEYKGTGRNYPVKAIIQNMVQVEEVRELVDKLPTSAQKELLDYITLKLMATKMSSPEERKFNMWKDSLVQEFSKSLGVSTRIFPLAQVSDAKKKFKEIEQLMLDFEMSGLNTKDTKIMYNFFARVFLDHASAVSARVNIPITIKLALQTNAPLAALVDNLFPGYIKSKLMYFVLSYSKSCITNVGNDEDEDT